MGFVSALLGIACLALSARDNGWLYELPRVAWLADRWGRAGARWTVAGLGIVLIALGVIIWLGIRPSYARLSTRDCPRLLSCLSLAFCTPGVPCDGSDVRRQLAGQWRVNGDRQA